MSEQVRIREEEVGKGAKEGEERGEDGERGITAIER